MAFSCYLARVETRGYKYSAPIVLFSLNDSLSRVILYKAYRDSLEVNESVFNLKDYYVLPSDLSDGEISHTISGFSPIIKGILG